MKFPADIACKINETHTSPPPPKATWELHLTTAVHVHVRTGMYAQKSLKLNVQLLPRNNDHHAVTAD